MPHSMKLSNTNCCNHNNIYNISYRPMNFICRTQNLSGSEYVRNIRYKSILLNIFYSFMQTLRYLGDIIHIFSNCQVPRNQMNQCLLVEFCRGQKSISMVFVRNAYKLLASISIAFKVYFACIIV